MALLIRDKPHQPKELTVVFPDHSGYVGSFLYILTTHKTRGIVLSKSQTVIPRHGWDSVNIKYSDTMNFPSISYTTNSVNIHVIVLSRMLSEALEWPRSYDSAV
ncbi:hypothetical protein NITHO_2030004 [Nitrolancea hollandica Lb]|uniref:Uncharacterized protein n=1 Tax=Nitrolancea hollandica Lb TaxID=1129897 RepID=I4EEV0_9BACT|nr:hypothetical protein NITHO_2030004 [Nitrolancea hollandica Lb]